jgi:hypothetical protein
MFAKPKRRWNRPNLKAARSYGLTPVPRDPSRSAKGKLWRNSGPVRGLICAVRTGTILPKDSFMTRFTNSICSLSTSTHLDCTAVTSGNAFGGNRAPSRVHKSVTKVELREGSFRIVSHPPSPPIMCTSVSRTERKLPPRSRVNSSTLRVETACKTPLFAQRSSRAAVQRTGWHYLDLKLHSISKLFARLADTWLVIFCRSATGPGGNPRTAAHFAVSQLQAS